jgi:hypothetical protein
MARVGVSLTFHPLSEGTRLTTVFPEPPPDRGGSALRAFLHKD